MHLPSIGGLSRDRNQILCNIILYPSSHFFFQSEAHTGEHGGVPKVDELDEHVRSCPRSGLELATSCLHRRIAGLAKDASGTIFHQISALMNPSAS